MKNTNMLCYVCNARLGTTLKLCVCSACRASFERFRKRFDKPPRKIDSDSLLLIEWVLRRRREQDKRSSISVVEAASEAELLCDDWKARTEGAEQRAAAYCAALARVQAIGCMACHGLPVMNPDGSTQPCAICNAQPLPKTCDARASADRKATPDEAAAGRERLLSHFSPADFERLRARVDRPLEFYTEPFSPAEADQDLEAAIDREAAEADGATYDLVESFNVDDGELDPATDPVSAFVLGVEWQLTLNEIKANPVEFNRTVHAANVARLIKLGWRHKRIVRGEHSADPNWVFLTFAARKP